MHAETTAAPNPAIPPKLWTVKEMAAYLQRSERWVRDHLHELPGYVCLPGGSAYRDHRFDSTKVLDWVKKGGATR